MNTINAMREAGKSWENIAHTLQAERDKLQHLLDGAQADYEDAMHALAKAEGRLAEIELGSEVIGKIEGYEADSVYARVRIGGMELPEVGTKLYLASQPTKAPEGYAVVPLRPSEAMRKAFWRAHDRYESGIGEMPDSGWRAMLEAREGE